jgi:hypothetical protein
MFEPFARTFLALGPPVILLAGTTATVILAAFRSDAVRWWVLGLGPILTLASSVAATWLVVTVLQPGEGSGFLLGGAAIGLFAMALGPYYLVLAGAAVWIRLRDSRASERGLA